MAGNKYTKEVDKGKKKKQGSNTHIRQNRLVNKGPPQKKKDPKGHFIILMGRIHQQDKNTVNTDAPNVGAPNI